MNEVIEKNDVRDSLSLNGTKNNNKRRIDVFSLFIVLGIGLWHAALPYTGEQTFYILNDNEVGVIFPVILSVFLIIAMPILFFSAGRAAWFNIQKRDTKQFLWERTRRLFIPFLIGMIFIVPVMSWVKYCVNETGWPTNNIFDVYNLFFDWRMFFTIFIPRFFSSSVSSIQWAGFPFLWSLYARTQIAGVPVPLDEIEYFQFGHYWFLYILFISVIFFLPLLLLIRQKKSERNMDNIAKFFEFPGTIYLLAIPIIMIEMFLSGMPDVIYNYATWNGYTLAILFLYGFILTGNQRYKEVFRKNRIVGVIVGAILSIVILVITYYRIKLYNEGGSEQTQDLLRLIYRGLKVTACWFFIVSIIGFGENISKKKKENKIKEDNLDKKNDDTPMKEFNSFEMENKTQSSKFSSKILPYLARAQLPFYIMHFPILIFLAFLIVPLNIPWFLEYLILALTTITLTLLLYDLMRRTIVTRYLFGIKDTQEEKEKQKIRREKRKEKKLNKNVKIT